MSKTDKKDFQEKETDLTVSVDIMLKDIGPIKILRDLLKMSRNYKGKMHIVGINLQSFGNSAKELQKRIEDGSIQG